MIRRLSTVVDPDLARAAVESYVDQQRRFISGDHGPADLNGGRLCEAVSRCLLQMDTSKTNHRLLPGKIREILLDDKRQHLLSAGDRKHISKVIETVYKFRSDRGAVHISPDYSANFMDSTLVIHAAKWILAEFLRLALKQEREVVAEMIARIVQLEHALVHELRGAPLVLVEGIPATDEVLLLLAHAEGNQMSRADLRRFASQQNPGTVSAATSRLINERDVRPLPGDPKVVALTPKGEKRVREILMPRLAAAV